MKKLLITLCLSISASSAFAQQDLMNTVFHHGPATEAASTAMGEDLMKEVMAASEKNMSEAETADSMFDVMKKYAKPLTEAMQKDCAADNDAKACACFYEKVNLNQFFDEMKAVVKKAKSEEDVDKGMSPIMQKLQSQKEQCKLK